MYLCLRRDFPRWFFNSVWQRGSLPLEGLFNILALDPLLPTFLLVTHTLCVLLVLTYLSLSLAWELLWASRRSPLPLDLSTEVVLTVMSQSLRCFDIDWMLEETWKINWVSCTAIVDFDLIEMANKTLKLNNCPGGGGSQHISKSK